MSDVTKPRTNETEKATEPLHELQQQISVFKRALFHQKILSNPTKDYKNCHLHSANKRQFEASTVCGKLNKCRGTLIRKPKGPSPLPGQGNLINKM